MGGTAVAAGYFYKRFLEKNGIKMYDRVTAVVMFLAMAVILFAGDRIRNVVRVNLIVMYLVMVLVYVLVRSVVQMKNREMRNRLIANVLGVIVMVWVLIWVLGEFHINTMIKI